MSTQAQPRSDVSTARVALGVLAAVVVSIAVNTGIALGATALNPDGTHEGLVPLAYGSLTVIGILAGTIGWAAVRRYATNARSVLRVLVPVVVVLSFIPDVGLLVSGSADAVNVAALLLMHLVVAVVTVATLARVLPLAGYRRTV